jgi:DNA processing protein
VELAKEIIKNGALVSEHPVGTEPLKQYFPARNRIISGLSNGVLICEAGEHSGTIHTANFALEQNRQLFAIPGPIYNPLSVGPNELLKLGAKAVTRASDILEDFGIDEV